MPLIALISDFGIKDWFVGELKGTLYAISPATTIIDITHEIPPDDVRAAAFVLLASYSSFPPDTIFCIAVGASSQKCRSIAVRTEKYFFIGQDNGSISWAVRKNDYAIWCIENTEFVNHKFGSTFQARDIFGPAAAHIAQGILISQIGTKSPNMLHIPFPQPIYESDKIHGEIIYIDRFGNAITNIESVDTNLNKTCECCVIINKYTVPVKSEYQDVNQLEGLCYPGSAGFMEIGVRGGNGALQLGIKIGQKVMIC